MQLIGLVVVLVCVVQCVESAGFSTSEVGARLLRLYGGAKKAAKKSKIDKSTPAVSKAKDVKAVAEKALDKPSLAETILQQQAVANVNKLIVDDSITDDLSVVSLSPAKLEELNLFPGDTVILKGKRRKDTLAIVNADEDVVENKICMTKVLRSNLRLRLGDTVTIAAYNSAKVAKGVTVLPFRDTVEGMSGDFFDVFVKPYFAGKSIPVKVGDVFQTRGAMRTVEFKVVAAEFSDETESEYCIISDQTEIFSEGEPLERKEDSRLDDIGYDDIGGCSRQLGQIRELVELPLRHPQIFRTVGIPPPRGVLMYGPPGSGKTMIAKAIAAETGAYFFLVNGPEIMSKLAGESESNLRKVNQTVLLPTRIFIYDICRRSKRRRRTLHPSSSSTRSTPSLLSATRLEARWRSESCLSCSPCSTASNLPPTSSSSLPPTDPTFWSQRCEGSAGLTAS
jgi:transitional endoplasmic reticulum ATPase